jgi:FkbM family methyltransferase
MTAMRSDGVSNLLASAPAFRGKSRIADALGRMAGKRNDGWGVCSPAPGVSLRVNLRDRIERLMWGGCYEPHVQRCLQALLRRGDLYLDAGAHIGFHTTVAASLVGTSGRVFAFEADPENFARLAEHCRPFPWTTAAQRAVWERSGRLTFERSPRAGESGWGSVTAVRDFHQGEHVEVEAISLDDWLVAAKVSAIRLIKLDAEGSEPAILRGAQELLTNLRPILILELNDVVLRQAGSSARELSDKLHRSSYELIGLEWPQLLRTTGNDEITANEVLAVQAGEVDAALTALQAAGFKV